MPQTIVLSECGGPEAFRLEDRAAPDPGPGELMVENSAAGVNFIDIYQRTGLYPVALPAVPGMEGAGTVVAVGQGVTGFRPGDRVAYLSTGGAYAAQTIVKAAMAAKLPDGIDDEVAAATFLKGLTAHMLLRQIYPLEEGRTALIHAAAGGVGSLLCQWAVHLGAQVIAVVGSADKARVPRDTGVAQVIVRSETDDLAATVRQLTGGHGVDVVYDSVGAATFEASLDALAPKGMMVSYGNASGPPPPIAPLELSRRGSLFLTRPTVFHYATPEALPAMAAELFERLSEGTLHPAAPTAFPLGEVSAAHQLLESSASTGSIILRPDPR